MKQIYCFFLFVFYTNILSHCSCYANAVVEGCSDYEQSEKFKASSALTG